MTSATGRGVTGDVKLVEYTGIAVVDIGIVVVIVVNAEVVIGAVMVVDVIDVEVGIDVVSGHIVVSGAVVEEAKRFSANVVKTVVVVDAVVPEVSGLKPVVVEVGPPVDDVVKLELYLTGAAVVRHILLLELQH